jgi:hypothetical protein
MAVIKQVICSLIAFQNKHLIKTSPLLPNVEIKFYQVWVILSCEDVKTCFSILSFMLLQFLFDYIFGVLKRTLVSRAI